MGRNDSDYERKKYFREYGRQRRLKMGMKPRPPSDKRTPPEKPPTSLRRENMKLYMRLYMRWWSWYGPVNDEMDKWAS